MKTDKNQPDQTHQNRRSTLKTLVVGGGTFTLSAPPAQWIKPVVDAVTLPAHAQTTGPETPAPNGFELILGAPAPGLLDRLVPKAFASEPLPPPGTLCIERDGSGWMASYDTGATVFTASGAFTNDCVSLVCGQTIAGALAVTQANEDGSFDFVIYAFGFCESPVVESVTNVPCSLGSCLEN